MGIGGLVVIFTLFGTSSFLQAKQPPYWSIPAILQPKFKITGSRLNSLIEPLKEQNLTPDKLIEVSFLNIKTLDEITHDVVPGFIQDTERTQSSQVFFMQGWDVRLIIPSSIKAYFKSNETIELKKLKNNTYELPKDKDFTVKIDAKGIEAELLLPQDSSPKDNNPITLMQKRAPAGTPIEYHLKGDIIKDIIKKEGKITVLFFSENSLKPFKVVSMDVKNRENKQGLWGTVVMPEVEFEKTLQPSKPLTAVALVTNESGDFTVKIDDIVVTRNRVGIFLGLAVIFIFLIIVLLSKATTKWTEARRCKWKQLSPMERFFRFPLHFAVTPLGRYSISLAQILFWTLIVIFAFVYVAFTRGEFLTITGQILTLLGISGTTAVVAKATAMARVGEIPLEYMKGIDENRIPRFRDLFSIGDVPHIFKFQIFAFTLLAGGQVIRELLQTGNFPELGENLLTLMGISGGIYIANELATENVWKKLDGLLKIINKKEEQKSAIDDELAIQSGELKELESQLEKLQNKVPKDDPDKCRVDELNKRIAEIKGKLKKKELSTKLEEDIGTHKGEVTDLLKKIYTEA
jgi:hypothetical protein